MLNLILKGEAHAVYQNTETNKYELWIIAGSKLDPKLIDQVDVFTDREDALDTLDFEETAYEDFFQDPYDADPDDWDEDEDEDEDWEPDISAEDLTEWQAASTGMNYYF